MMNNNSSKKRSKVVNPYRIGDFTTSFTSKFNFFFTTFYFFTTCILWGIKTRYRRKMVALPLYRSVYNALDLSLSGQVWRWKGWTAAKWSSLARQNINELIHKNRATVS